MKVLVKYKADVNAKDKSGETPLYRASKRGDLDMVKFLVENKADIHAQNKWGGTPLSEAKRIFDVDIVEFLQSRGATG